MAFDVKGALAEGYTPSEIADYLAQSRKFDVIGARKEGYSDIEIIDHLTKSRTAGIGEAIKGGTKRLLSSARTAIEAPFGGEEAAISGLERQEAITERPGASLEEVKRVYEQEGFLPAAKEAISQIPSAIAEQAPVLATMAGGYRTGFALTPPALPVVGPLAKPIGGAIGAAIAPFISQAGSNIERQAAEQIQQGKPIDVDVAKAYGAAVPQAALDVVSLRLGLGRLLGVSPKAMGTVAAESKLRAALKGTGKAAIAELPTEITQQMLERAQAGLSLTDEDALKEYADVGYQAALMAPIGGAARMVEAGEARQREDDLIRAEQKRIAGIQAEGVKTRAEAELALAQATAEQKALIAAQIKASPNKSLIDIINEVNGIKPAKPITTAKNVSAALNEPSGIRVSDPETGLERELTVGEHQQLLYPELFNEPEAPFGGMLPNRPNEEMMVFPDGSVGTQEQADAFIQSLPEDQQIEARASLMGYAPEAVEGYTTPVKLDETTLTSLVPSLTPRAGVYKRLLNLNVDSKENLAKLRGELSKLGDKYAVNETKLKEIEDAYKQNVSQRTTAERDLTGAGLETPRAGISTTGERLGRGSARGAEGTELGGVAPIGGPVRESTDGTGGLNAPVEAQAPASQEVMKAETAPEEVAAEEIPPSAEELKLTRKALKQMPGSPAQRKTLAEIETLKQARIAEAPVDYTVEAKKVATELRALDPANPMIETLQDELAVTPEEVAAARQEVNALRQGREDVLQAATEELPTVDERALEPDVDEEAFNQAKDLLGAYTRQRIGGVKNITPEEQISTAQALAALGDIMYYIVKKGVKSAGQAIIRARRVLGTNAKYITPEQFQAAYDQAVERVEQTPVQPMAQPSGDLFEQTAEFMPPEVGQKDSVVDIVKNFDRSVINTENVNKFVTNARVNLVYSGAGVADKLTEAYEGAVTNALTKEVRADILMSQALSSNKLAAEAAMDGKIVFDDNGVAKVVDDPNSLKSVFESLAALGEKIGADKARHAAQAYMVGLRYQSWLKLNDELDVRIAQAKAKGQRAVVQKLERRKKFVSEAQEAAIPAALKFGDVYPEVKDIAAKYEAAKNNEIDMLEQAGYYSKETADEYRATKGYVPLYRIMDDIEELAPGAKQYFRGFADVGAEKRATGSERQVDDVFDNMMTRHMWAVNAAVRNRANRAVANQLGIVNNDGVLITTDKVQPGAENNSAPVWINGERKYVQYSDPTFAQGIQGLEPALGPFMSILAGASKIMRMGITMLPPFQLAMVFNDAPRAALNSGVERPFQVMGKVLSSFTQILKDPNDPFVVEMRRLGITGGYGHTAKEVSTKLRRDLGMESNSFLQRALDKAETFAAASDLAQRRAIYMQTMEETNNPVLAMHRALDIINFQKHGRSAKVRALTQVVPFMNAYLQGMDVLYQAMSGKGISGKQKRQAQMLFMQTAIKLAALSALYSMLVADDEDYQKLDDREKVRALIIPGTGVKIPVAADVAMLVKAIPELGYQYIVREGTDNPMDATKLFSGISQSFMDGLSGPNLMPQALRAGFEVAVNRSFLTGNPIVGRGLENLATEEQFTENTSRLARLIGSTGILSPMNADHLMKGYGGTTASLLLYATDALVNQVADVKTPSVPIYRTPSINAFLYSTQGKGQLNDYYDLKDKSDEVAATLNNKMKYGTAEDVQAYREENKEMLAVRSRVNAMTNQIKTLREQRKRIIAGDLPADAKRERLDEIDNRIANVVKNIGAIRVRAGL